MRNLAAFVILAASVGLFAGLSPVAAAPEYRLVIACPPGELTGPVTSNSYNTCPIKAVDSDDLMGSPSLDVHPRNLDRFVLGSLHGLSDPEGATERSRRGETFTTFVSYDHGGTWNDRPFAPPNHVGLSSNGEHPQVIFDRHGQVYVGSLYSTRVESEDYRYTIVVQKFSDLAEADARQNGRGEYGAHYISPIYELGQIQQFWLVYPPVGDTVVAVWGERAPTVAAHGERSVIGIAWTTSGTKEPFHYHDEEDLVGPCRTTSNPVVHDGHIYIGCAVDPTEGVYRWDPAAVPDRVDLFRIPLRGGEPTFVGATPLTGGEPRLLISSTGRLVAMSSTVDATGMPKLVAAYGRLVDGGSAADWGTLDDYASQLFQPLPGYGLIEANIQNLAYRERTGAVHLIWKLRYEPPEVGLSINRPAALVEPQISKFFLAVHEDHGVLANLDLHVGESANRTIFGGHPPGSPEGPFNDLADGIVQMPPKPFEFEETYLGDDYQREFIAVGDYGIIVIAEIIEFSNLPPPGPPPGAQPPPPIAAAAASNTLTFALSAAAGLTFAGVLAAKLALSRRYSHAGSSAKER